MGALWPIGQVLVFLAAAAQPATDAARLMKEAERLAWLRAWTRAAPLYEEAGRLFKARGDHRNVLYAEINRLRGELPRLSVPEVSQRLAEYLDDPLVQRDKQLRLRCLIIKGETDTDLDPSLAEQSWQEAFTLAKQLGESGWANRANGELGILAFLQGDVSASVIRLGTALKTAEATGDVASQVRWLTVFGHGYVQVGRTEEALNFYDRALNAGADISELQFPLMTYVGKGGALSKLGRFAEAERVLRDALAVAADQGALGYQAELLMNLALIEHQRKQTNRALESFAKADDFARQAGAKRVLAEIALDLAPIQRARGSVEDAEKTLLGGIDAARSVADWILLPRLLAQLADLKSSQRRFEDAGNLLKEARDLLEGSLTHTSSPWIRSRLIAVMDDVFDARIRLEGLRGANPERMFAILEQARGRSLLDLLLSRSVGELTKPPELRKGEREIAALQLKLYRTTDTSERQRLLDEIFETEGRLAPISTELFDKTQTGDPRQPVTLAEVRHALSDAEVLLAFMLAEPASYCLAVTRTAARVQRLPGRLALRDQLQPFLDKVRSGEEASAESATVAKVLLDPLRELSTHERLIVSPDGDLHYLPFELLAGASGKRLLETHVVSYVPSASILTVIRSREGRTRTPQVALAVSASPSDGTVPAKSATAVDRGIYGLEGAQLRPLPSAEDEARSVTTILGPSGTALLVGNAATEQALKRTSLDDYRVLHFAAHGILSTRFPARSALVLQPGGGEDGLLQAREILAFRLGSDLVTLSACDTGSGALHGQDGVSSLVRPFLAAGARSVVANLWAADDKFSLALMREFYRQLASGADVADALRRAKLTMLEQFGPQAVPKFWSGVLVYGDAAATVASPARRGQ